MKKPFYNLYPYNPSKKFIKELKESAKDIKIIPLGMTDFEYQAYLMDKKGRKQRPSFSNNWPEGVRD